MYKKRTYRRWVQASDDLVSFEVKARETDLLILASGRLERQAMESILTHRGSIEQYIKAHPDFYTSLAPLREDKEAPEIIRAMMRASAEAKVGPMAAVAGAVAEFVGRDLLASGGDVIVENGGDIFIKSSKKRLVGIYAGDDSPFTGRLALEVAPSEDGIGVCTSSGTVSHSLSFGNADAVLIVSQDTALADAAATAAGNAVKEPGDIPNGIDIAKSIKGVAGVLIMAKDKMGSWGEIKLV